MLNFKSVKVQLIAFLVCFALFLASVDRDMVFLTALAIAVASSLAAESLFIRFKTKNFQITESSIITGLIVGFVFSSDQPWWMIAAASLFAISSKHLLRFRNRHVFNPAAFGIFLATIFLQATTQWKGTFIWPVLLPFGAYFAWKVNKIEILVSYVAVSLGLFGIQALFQKIPVWNIFGYLSYFYIFIMVIEPMTTPVKRFGKILFGCGVAVLVFALTELGVRFDVELLGLLSMNIAAAFLKGGFKKEGGKV